MIENPRKILSEAGYEVKSLRLIYGSLVIKNLQQNQNLIILFLKKETQKLKRSLKMYKKALLINENGDEFIGWSTEEFKPATGELIFNTAMTGFVEILVIPHT